MSRAERRPPSGAPHRALPHRRRGPPRRHDPGAVATRPGGMFADREAIERRLTGEARADVAPRHGVQIELEAPAPGAAGAAKEWGIPRKVSRKRNAKRESCLTGPRMTHGGCRRDLLTQMTGNAQVVISTRSKGGRPVARSTDAQRQAPGRDPSSGRAIAGHAAGGPWRGRRACGRHPSRWRQLRPLPARRQPERRIARGRREEVLPDPLGQLRLPRHPTRVPRRPRQRGRGPPSPHTKRSLGSRAAYHRRRRRVRQPAAAPGVYRSRLARPRVTLRLARARTGWWSWRTRSPISGRAGPSFAVPPGR